MYIKRCIRSQTTYIPTISSHRPSGNNEAITRPVFIRAQRLGIEGKHLPDGRGHALPDCEINKTKTSSKEKRTKNAPGIKTFNKTPLHTTHRRQPGRQSHRICH